MTAGDSPLDSRRRLSHWWAVAGVLLLVAVGCLWVGLSGDPAPVAEPIQTRQKLPATLEATTPKAIQAARPVVAPPAPVELRIPSIGVAANVAEMGLNRDQTVQVPSNAANVGWFRLGPSPGQLGSAVILGHVDSVQGPAVFYRLRELRVGNRILVRLADGAAVRFEVRSVKTYLNERFPARKVYGSHGYSGLQLITCGGNYDSETGYQSNVVVYTTRVTRGG